MVSAFAPLNLVDNPLNNYGYVCGYDNLLNRFLITKLDFKTVYNGYNIGSFRKNCREKYKKLTKKEQEMMKKEFDVISEDFLISKSRKAK